MKPEYKRRLLGLIIFAATFQINCYNAVSAYAKEIRCEAEEKGGWEPAAWPPELKEYAGKDVTLYKAVIGVHGEIGYLLEDNFGRGQHAAPMTIYIEKNHIWHKIFDTDVDILWVLKKTSNGFYNLCDPVKCCGDTTQTRYYFNGLMYGTTPNPKPNNTLEINKNELVLNGGFESKDFTGWNYTAHDKFSTVHEFSHGGLYAASLGDQQESGGGTISQTLKTAPGTDYILSFWFAGNGDKPSGLSVLIGDKTVLQLTDPPMDKQYKPYTFRFTVSSASTLLQFHFYDDKGYINLDDISVIPAPVSR